MPRDNLTLAYTGRPELEGCRVWLRTLVGPFVPFSGPFDLGISAAGSHIFRLDEITRARYGIVNLHLAPLPGYRGRFSATHAILNGETEFGVTLHYVDEGIDTGPIIAERRFPIGPADTARTIRAQALAEGSRLFLAILPPLLSEAAAGRRLPCHPQTGIVRYYDRFSLPSHTGDPLMTRALTA